MANILQLTGLTAAMALSIAACTATPAEEADAPDWMSDARLGEKVDRICFKSSIDNFRANTRNTVIVEKGVKDEFLIQTAGSCYDLDSAQALSFDTFTGSGCVSKGDSIYAFDSPFGPDRSDGPTIRCPIAAIYEWNEDAAEPEEDAEE